MALPSFLTKPRPLVTALPAVSPLGLWAPVGVNPADLHIFMGLDVPVDVWSPLVCKFPWICMSP